MSEEKNKFMKNQTLLEKAKAAKGKTRSSTVPDVDTLLAWLNGEISLGQISVALGKPHNQPSYVYAFLIRSIRAAYAQGRIKIVDKP